MAWATPAPPGLSNGCWRCQLGLRHPFPRAGKGSIRCDDLTPGADYQARLVVYPRGTTVLGHVRRGQNHGMLSDEVASALGPFFDRIGPSHDEIRVLVKRSGLQDLDPERSAEGPIGKMKRVKGVLFAAVEERPREGEQLVRSLVDSVRANGGFRPGNENYPGEEVIAALRGAFRNVGADLDAEGNLRPIHMEALDGRDLTDALWSYVRRARRGGWDATLVVGVAKSLEEAAARHVLKEQTGNYPTHANMVTTLYSAFLAVGLAVPDQKVLDGLEKDPRAALQQAVWLLAFAVNRFRNVEGEGHGRPESGGASDAEADLVGIAAALVTQLLLDALDRT